MLVSCILFRSLSIFALPRLPWRSFLASAAFLFSLTAASVADPAASLETVFAASFESPTDIGGLELQNAVIENGALVFRGTAGASLDYRLSGSAYAVALKLNPGLVTWSFRFTPTAGSLEIDLGNVTKDVAYYFNTGYRLTLTGGALKFDRFGYFTWGPPPNAVLLTASTQLSPGQEGTFRVTFDPATSRWSIYGGPSIPGGDPATESRLLGEVVDSQFTVEDLPSGERGLFMFSIHSPPVSGPAENRLDDLRMTAFTRPNHPPVVSDNYNLNPIVNTDINGKKFYDFYPLFNDSDPDGDTLQIVSVKAAHGDTSLGYYWFSYTTDEASPADRFEVLVSDGRGGLATEIVTFNKSSNRPPYAPSYDTAFVVNGVLELDLLANASDPDGDPITLGNVTTTYGNVELLGGGKIRLTVGADFNTTGNIRYTVSDGQLSSPEAIVIFYPCSKGNFFGLVSAESPNGDYVGTVRGTADGLGYGTLRGELFGQQFSWHGKVTYGEYMSIPVHLPGGEVLNLQWLITAGLRIAPGSGVVFERNGVPYRGLLDPIQPPGSLVGRYTFLIDPDSDPAVPPAYGFGIAAVTRTGEVRLTGRLPDGTPFSARSLTEHSRYPDASRVAPIWSRPYHGAGAFAGYALFQPMPGSSDFHGDFQWQRPATPALNRPAVRTHRSMIGSRYHFADTESVLRTVGPAPVLAFLGAGLSQPLLVTTTRGSAPVLRSNATGQRSLINFQPRLGYWSGAFEHPQLGHDRVYGGGVVFPRQGFAAGAFQRGASTGLLRILPDAQR